MDQQCTCKTPSAGNGFFRHSPCDACWEKSMKEYEEFKKNEPIRTMSQQDALSLDEHHANR